MFFDDQGPGMHEHGDLDEIILQKKEIAPKHGPFGMAELGVQSFSNNIRRCDFINDDGNNHRKEILGKYLKRASYVKSFDINITLQMLCQQPSDQETTDHKKHINPYISNSSQIMQKILTML